MITYFEYKNILKKDFISNILNAVKKDGIAIIKFNTDDNKIQVKQFEEIKKELKYKPDKNIKFYWNNSNNFIIVDTEKTKIFEI